MNSAVFSSDGGQGKGSKKLFKGMAKIFKKKNQSHFANGGLSEDDLNELQTLRTIDQRSIPESDSLVGEYDHFFAEAQRTIDFTRKTTSTKHAKFNPMVMSDKINQWRAKRKGNVLHDSYTTLMSRTESVEQSLKTMTDHSLSDASTLLLQAVSLKTRLLACIEYNRTSLASKQPFMVAVETLLRNLENARHDVMDMLGFLDEVNLLHNNADAPFVPWALRNSDGRDITVIPFKREVLEKRLRRVEKALDAVERLYKGCRPVYDKLQKDLTHCQQCLSALENLQSKIESHVTFMSELDSDKEERENPIAVATKKRSQSGSSSANDGDGQPAISPPASPRTDGSPRTTSTSKHLSPEALLCAAQEPFDHSHCSDCALTCLMANDCAMNLAAAQHLAQEGTGRLQRLFEMRERAKDKAQELDSLDWGEAAK